MHIGHSIDTKYYTNDGSERKELQSVHQERDLGVIVTSNLKRPAISRLDGCFWHCVTKASDFL